jgi:hypothetical protein
MFTRLAESTLVKVSLVRSRRIAPGPGEAIMHSNDNLPGFRRPKGRRRIPTPALACHWIDRNGRLECRWQVETGDDAPIADVDGHPRRIGRISHNRLRTVLSGARLPQRPEHWLGPAAKVPVIAQDFHRERID